MRPPRCPVRRLLAGSLLGTGLAGAAACRRPQPAPVLVRDSLQIHFLDVGQGDGTLIVCPQGDLLLVDLGSKKSKAVITGPILAFLRPFFAVRGDTLDVLILTHPDVDHYNLVDTALTGVVVKRIVYGGAEDEYGRLAGWLERRRAQTIVLGDDSYERPGGGPGPIVPCRGGDVRVLAANVPTRDAANSNTKSVVLRLQYGTRVILLGADATARTEESIRAHFAAYPGYLQSGALKVPHHGSETSSTPAFLRAVNPVAAFISADEHEGFRLPRCTVVDSIRRYTRVAGASATHSYICSDGAGWRTRAGSRDAIFTTLRADDQGVYYWLFVFDNDSVQIGWH